MGRQPILKNLQDFLQIGQELR